MSSPTLFDDFFQEENGKNDALAEKRKKAKEEIKSLSNSKNKNNETSLFEEEILNVSVYENINDSTNLEEEKTNNIGVQNIEFSGEKKSFIHIELPEENSNDIDQDNDYDTTINDLITLHNQYVTEIDYFDRTNLNPILSNENTQNVYSKQIEHKDNVENKGLQDVSFVTENELEQNTHSESTIESEIASTNDEEYIDDFIDPKDDSEIANAIIESKVEINENEVTIENEFSDFELSDEDTNVNRTEEIQNDFNSKEDNDENLEPLLEETQELPEWQLEDKYYGIGEVAKLFNVNVSHLRFWCQEFNMKPRTTRKGTRLFTKKQVEELRQIHFLVKQKKYTIKGARAQLKTRPKEVDATMSLKQKLENLKSQLVSIKLKLENE